VAGIMGENAVAPVPAVDLPPGFRGSIRFGGCGAIRYRELDEEDKELDEEDS
jgi:hypothetical protein